MSTEKRAYGKVREMIEHPGGTMVYDREGYRHGAWELSLDAKTRVIESMGVQSFPELNNLYKPLPGVPSPKTWDDYQDELTDDAETRLGALFTRRA